MTETNNAEPKPSERSWPWDLRPLRHLVKGDEEIVALVEALSGASDDDEIQEDGACRVQPDDRPDRAAFERQQRREQPGYDREVDLRRRFAGDYVHQRKRYHLEGPDRGSLRKPEA